MRDPFVARNLTYLAAGVQIGRAAVEGGASNQSVGESVHNGMPFLTPRLSKSIVLIAIALCANTSTPAADYFPPPDSEGGWRTLSDAAQIRDLAGMDLSRLERAFD